MQKIDFLYKYVDNKHVWTRAIEIFVKSNKKYNINIDKAKEEIEEFIEHFKHHKCDKIVLSLADDEETIIFESYHYKAKEKI